MNCRGRKSPENRRSEVEARRAAHVLKFVSPAGLWDAIRSNHFRCGSVHDRLTRIFFGGLYTIRMGNQWLCKCHMANVSDDGCGNVLVGRFTNRYAQVLFGEPCIIHGKLQLSQLSTRQIAWASGHDDQCRDRVLILGDVFAERLDVILKLGRCAVTSFYRTYEIDVLRYINETSR